MKILFHNPSCGSGIEQVGYIFLLLLKKLGHEIDFWNTQCAHQQETVISGMVNQYDAVVLNSAYNISFDRLIKKPADNIFNISHDGSPLPEFCKQLSLNYINQYQYLYRPYESNGRSVIFPITYPYAFEPSNFNSVRPYKFIYVGRWCEAKFNPGVKKFMEENGLKIDVAIVSDLDNGYSPETIANLGIKNANIGHITEYYRKAKFLLVPSTTECITIVAGEALANGCIPITLETPEEVHKQFFNCITPHSINEFNETVMKLSQSDSDPIEIKREEAFKFTNRMWNIEKTLEELRVIFGTGDNGKINLMSDDYEITGAGGYAKTTPYINATIITGETIS